MPKTRNNQRMNKDILRRLYQPAGNIAFLDAEFNCGMDWATGDSVNEVISIGIVICDPSYQEIHRFYSLVNPKSGRPIFPTITRMTGITAAMLQNQPGFATVSNKITDLFKQYQVWDLFAWGNADQHALSRERTNLKNRHYASQQAMAKWFYIDMCTDISEAVSSEMLGIKGGLSINMENLMFVCEIEEQQEHNAFTDALYLFRSMAYLQKAYPDHMADQAFKEKKELVNRYYQERSTYNSFRRFRSTSKGADLYGKWEDVRETGSRDMRIRALEDDLKFLKGEIPANTEFDSIQEYFRKAKGR